MKTNVTLSLDVEVYAEARSRAGNRKLSVLVNDLLKEWLNIKRPDVDSMSEESLRLEIAKQSSFNETLKKKLQEIEDEKKGDRIIQVFE